MDLPSFLGTFRYDTDMTLADRGAGHWRGGGVIQGCSTRYLDQHEFHSGDHITLSSLGPMVESWLHVSLWHDMT